MAIPTQGLNILKTAAATAFGDGENVIGFPSAVVLAALLADALVAFKDLLAQIPAAAS